MKDDDVIQELNRLFQKALDRFEVSEENILEELVTIAFSDMGDYVHWDENGVTFLPADQIDSRKRRAIQKIKAKTHARRDKEGNQETTTDIELQTWNKLQALIKLGESG